MKYQPWNKFDPFGLMKKKKHRAALGGWYLVGFTILGTLYCIDDALRKNHLEMPAVITQLITNDKPPRIIYHAKDSRGLFPSSYDFIVAQNKADSTYAYDEHLDLGKFQGNKVVISEHRPGGRSGWNDPETMNYKMDN